MPAQLARLGDADDAAPTYATYSVWSEAYSAVDSEPIIPMQHPRPRAELKPSAFPVIVEMVMHVDGNDSCEKQRPNMYTAPLGWSLE